MARITKKQRAWLEYYEVQTGYDVIKLDELEAGTITFAEVRRWNTKWYEGHIQQVLNNITGDKFPI